MLLYFPISILFHYVCYFLQCFDYLTSVIDSGDGHISSLHSCVCGGGCFSFLCMCVYLSVWRAIWHGPHISILCKYLEGKRSGRRQHLDVQIMFDKYLNGRSSHLLFCYLSNKIRYFLGFAIYPVT